MIYMIYVIYSYSFFYLDDIYKVMYLFHESFRWTRHESLRFGPSPAFNSTIKIQFDDSVQFDDSIQFVRSSATIRAAARGTNPCG